MIAATLRTQVLTLSTQDIRSLVGAMLSELRSRKVGKTIASADSRTIAKTDGAFPHDGVITASEHAQAAKDNNKQRKAEAGKQVKEDYKAKKAEYESRLFGVRRAADGKELKRRFNTLAEAQQAADDLVASMKGVQYLAFTRS